MTKLEFLVELARLPRTYRFFWKTNGPIRCFTNIDGAGYMMDPLTALYHYKTKKYESVGRSHFCATTFGLGSLDAEAILADIDGHPCEYRLDMLDIIAMRDGCEDLV